MASTHTHSKSTSRPHFQSQALPSPRILITSILSNLFTPIAPQTTSHETTSHEEIQSTTHQPQPHSHSPSLKLGPTSQTIPLPTNESHNTTTIKSEKAKVEDEKPSNPLKTLSPSQRALLTTLHVLIPPPTLLQAFDLLDRRCVSKIIYLSEEEDNQDTSHINPIPPAEDSTMDERKDDTAPSRPREEMEREKCVERIMYQVQSSNPSSRNSRYRERERDRDFSSSTQGNIYTINLEAWSCNCAAFAFSSFPYVSSSPLTSTSRGGYGREWRDIFPAGEEEDEDEEDNDDLDPTRKTPHVEDVIRNRYGDGMEKIDDREWEYGGLSVDGRESGSDAAVPICKHLLAVLLVEKWDLMKEYMDVRIVRGGRGRDEVAGLAAGG